MADGQRWIELGGGDGFAGYRIERALGRGGMGVLYLAIEPGLERRVALKLIAPEAAADEVFSRRFAEESRIAASIEHPNVVPIYAAGEEGGVPFIAMRYVSGSDLGKRLTQKGKMEPSLAATLIAQVANGLDAIHAAGLVHRDVKPANVLLSGAVGEEHAYITDFGVARNVATESGLTQTGRFVGTLDYVAPEQISGDEVDARADVYALGCLLYKLLTGEVPFPRDGEAARLYAHLNDPAPAPSLYVPQIPMALDDVVIRAMSKAPEDRYPSAGDLGRAAAAAFAGEQPTVPERTVATGAAATRESVAPEPAAVPTPSAASSEAETIRVSGGLQPPAPPPSGAQGRRRFALAAGLTAAGAIVIAAIALGGGGSDPNTTQGGDPQAGGAPERKARPEPTPEPLSRSELISKGDEICNDSQTKYREVRDPDSEEVPDVAYSATLVGISTPAVRRFRALDPPTNIQAEYEAYVKSQEEVSQWDREALRAAKEGNEAAYLEAREERNETQPERYELAREIGFEVCSPRPD